MNYCSYCMARIEGDKPFCPHCGANLAAEIPSHHLRPGALLDGKYVVGAALGEGGFGITYIGRDLNLDMKVAIKEYYPNGYVNRNCTVSLAVETGTVGERRDFFEKGKERFLSEARILAKFADEPGIVTVRDFFEANETAYIVMEFIEGDTLKDYLKKNGCMTPIKVVALLFPVMKSLQKVHAQGLIHRDISPDNIMLKDGRAKLLDFGAARNVSAVANHSLSVVLKPGYAPEEQYRSRGQQGPWTDVYALCATLYKCITGVTPDDATQRVYYDEVKKPSELGISISPGLESVIMKGFAVSYRDRYQGIEDLVADLQKAMIGEENAGKTIVIPKRHTAFVEEDSRTEMLHLSGSANEEQLDDEALWPCTEVVRQDNESHDIPSFENQRPIPSDDLRPTGYYDSDLDASGNQQMAQETPMVSDQPENENHLPLHTYVQQEQPIGEMADVSHKSEIRDDSVNEEIIKSPVNSAQAVVQESQTSVESSDKTGNPKGMLALILSICGFVSEFIVQKLFTIWLGSVYSYFSGRWLIFLLALGCFAILVAFFVFVIILGTKSLLKSIKQSNKRNAALSAISLAISTLAALAIVPLIYSVWIS